MLNFYGSLSSEVYDIDKPIGQSFGDIEFYKERLVGINGKVLEPAVGSGVEELKLILQEVGFIDIVISSNYNHGEYPTNVNQSITFEAVKK